MSLPKFSLRRAMCAAMLIGSGLLAANLHAHQCGPTQIQLAPGEVFEYQITADLIEVLSDYTPLDTGNPNVAILSPAVPFSAHHGVFTIIATGFGETKFRIRWFYAGTGASNVCEVTVVVDATRRTSATGLLSFNIDRKRFVSDFDLAKMIDAAVPQATKRFLVFAQCYGGEFAASPFFNKPNTATTAATRTGEQAQYSGYHDDAARALRPEPGRTGETVHFEGTAGIFQGAAFNDFPEHPTTGGGLPLASFSFEPVTATGAVQSRHVIAYAGKPDTKSWRDPETGDTLSDGQGGKRQTRDVQDRNNIRTNFAAEPNTTVWAVGGEPDAADPTLGTDGWDFSGTPEGLAAAFDKVRLEIAKSPDPSKEQFALFVGDHGDFREGGLTRVPLNPNSRSVVSPAFAAMGSAQAIGAADPAFTFYVSFEGQNLPIQRDAQGNYVPFFGASDFTMDVTPNGGQTILLDTYTEHYLELGDNIVGNQPGEGLLFRFPVAPDLFRSTFVDTTLAVGITSKTSKAITVNELAQETGPVARGPYDVAPEPNLVNTPAGLGPVALRFEGLNLSIENVSTPGLTIADRETARTGGLPPGVSMLIPHTSWSIESTAVFGTADVSIRTILPAGDTRAERIVGLKAEGAAPFEILPTTRRIEDRQVAIVVTATVSVTDFSHFALGVLVSGPILDKAFNPTTIAAGGTTTLTFTITNPAASPAASNVGFVDTLPAGLRLANATAGGTCANAAAATTVAAGGSTISVASLQVPAGPSTCTVTVNVTNVPPQTGTCPNASFTNTANNISGTVNVTNAVISSCVTVTATAQAPSLTKAFSPSAINAGGIATLTFTIANPAVDNPAQVVSFNDTLPAGLKIAAAPNVGGTCTGGTVTAAAGASIITVAGKTVPASNALAATCTVTVDVTNVTGQFNASCANAPAAFTNGGPNIGSLSNLANAVTQSCVVVNAVNANTFSILKVPSANALLPGSPLNFTITVTNNGPSAANGSILADPAIAGFVASAINCTNTTNGAACPVSANVTLANLQGAGIVLPTFPANSTITFVLSGTFTQSSGNVVNTAIVTSSSGVTAQTQSSPVTVTAQIVAPANIPTISEQALLALILLLAIAGATYVGRVRR